MKILCSSAISGALLAVTLSTACAQNNSSTSPAPTVRPAIDAVLDAFKNHPLVGLEDAHTMAQEEDFFAALVRDPRFASQVGNVVVEFGNAADQNIIDRYVDGQEVPYPELRKVWTDPVGWSPPPFFLGYINFFAQVRATNSSLPPERRIHVWLGDPPVDWSKVQKRGDVPATPDWRENYPAELIDRQILDRGLKALVIYGAWHFNTDTSLYALVGPQPSMATLIARAHPGALFIVTPYDGFLDKSCDLAFEKDKNDLSAPVILTPVRGTSLDDASFRQRCPKGAHEPIPPGVTKEQMPQLIEHFESMMAGVDGDALLYLGPAASLTYSPMSPDAYLDESYSNEVMRDMQIFIHPGATPSIMGMSAQKNIASPRPYQH